MEENILLAKGSVKFDMFLPILKIDKTKNIKEQLAIHAKKVEINSLVPIIKIINGEIITLIYDREKNIYIKNDNKELLYFDKTILSTKKIQTMKIEGFSQNNKEIELNKKIEEMNKVLDKSSLLIEELKKSQNDLEKKLSSKEAIKNEIKSEQNKERGK